MKKLLVWIGCLLVSGALFAQTFEISGMQENYKGSIGDLIKAPIRLKNISNKPITLILKKSETQLGSSQNSFFCMDSNCLEKTEELVVKIEPGQTVQNFSIGLEAGLVEGFSAVRYMVINKFNPGESSTFELNFAVESRPEKSSIYSSQYITIHDVYPNPITNFANIDYQLHSDQVKTKIVIHNILGNSLNEYELPFSESRVKILADELSAGIYFYTLYIDNVGVMTRKLIVKK